jgi:transcriptional regulator with XRE-family HTH domain
MISADNTHLVELALKATGMIQNQLARKLGVSPTQITKWKQGEYMSTAMEGKIKALAKIPEDLEPLLVVWAGSIEAAEKWESSFGIWQKMPTTTPRPDTIPILWEMRQKTCPACWL